MERILNIERPNPADWTFSPNNPKVKSTSNLFTTEPKESEHENEDAKKLLQSSLAVSFPSTEINHTQTQTDKV